MWGPWDGGVWAFGMALGMFLFLALIVAGIVLLLRPRGPEPRREHDRALEILSERFARGEIDREEYEERRRVLESGTT